MELNKVDEFDIIMNEINCTIDNIEREAAIYKGRSMLLYATLYYDAQRKLKAKQFIRLLSELYLQNKSK